MKVANEKGYVFCVFGDRSTSDETESVVGGKYRRRRQRALGEMTPIEFEAIDLALKAA